MGGVKHISGIEREKHESIREHGTCTPWRGEDEMLYNIYLLVFVRYGCTR